MLAARFMFSIALVLPAAGTAWCQDYPRKPIRIVTSGVGGGNDYVARLIAQGVQDALGAAIIVDNRSAGVIAGDIVSKAAPDGYTLLVFGAPLWIGPLLQKAPYDTLRDFSDITLAVSSPNVLVVNPQIKATTVKELIDLAKAKPGQLNYSSASVGGSTHLAAELFKSMAGVNIVRIPYKSGSMQMADLISGQVQLTFSNAPEVMPHVNSGRLRGLAVTSAEPSALVPGLPTVASSGLPGYDAVALFGVFAPAKTPAAVINRLNREIVRFLHRPDVKDKILLAGVEPIGSTPEQMDNKLRLEIKRMGQVIKDAGIRAE